MTPRQLQAAYFGKTASVEITTAKPREAQRAWPGVTYKGNDVFRAYMAVQSDLQRAFKEDTGCGPSDTYCDGQEVFLGYSSELDLFVSAWDWWPEGDNKEPHTYYEVLKMEGGRMTLEGYVDYMYDLVYPTNVRKIEKKFKIDQPLRYD